MRDIELVVFDWDGTLMDSTGAIAESIQLAAGDLGLPIPSRAAASHVIGLALRQALQYAVPSLAAERLDEFTERYRHHYTKRDQQLRPFDGIEGLLSAIGEHAIPTAIATGKSRLGLERALHAVNWHHFFKTSRCADEGLPKPDPWMLLQVCEKLGVDPQRTVMIGDTSHDMLMAKAAGTWSIAVGYGAHPMAELRQVGASAYCESVDALRALLLPILAKPGLVGSL